MKYYEITDILDLEGEVWKTHPVFDEYEGSNYGRVRAKERYTVSNWGRTGKNTKPIMRKWAPKIVHQHKAFNYLSVQIRRRGYFVHRFICECWNGMAPELQVDHINEDKYDNVPSNLRWTTASENVTARGLSYRKEKTRKTNYPENEWAPEMVHTRWINKGGPIWVCCVGKKILKIFEKRTDAAKWIGCDPATIKNRMESGVPDSEGRTWLLVHTIHHLL